MAKKYYCTFPGYRLLFRYEGMRRDKQYEYPVEKYIEMQVTDIDYVEGDNKKRVRNGYVDPNPRANDPSFKGGTLESSPSYQVPVTEKTLQWIGTPERDCPDIVTAFLMSVRPTNRPATLPNTGEPAFLCQVINEIGQDFLCVDVPEGTPDSFPDDFETPKEMLEKKEIQLSSEAKVVTKKKKEKAIA